MLALLAAILCSPFSPGQWSEWQSWRVLVFAGKIVKCCPDNLQLFQPLPSWNASLQWEVWKNVRFSFEERKKPEIQRENLQVSHASGVPHLSRSEVKIWSTAKAWWDILCCYSGFLDIAEKEIEIFWLYHVKSLYPLIYLPGMVTREPSWLW